MGAGAVKPASLVVPAAAANGSPPPRKKRAKRRREADAGAAGVAGSGPGDHQLGPRAATLRLLPLLRRVRRLIRQGASAAQEEDTCAELLASLGPEWVLELAKRTMDPSVPSHRKAVYEMASACKATEHARSLAMLNGGVEAMAAVSAPKLPTSPSPAPLSNPDSPRARKGKKKPPSIVPNFTDTPAALQPASSYGSLPRQSSSFVGRTVSSVIAVTDPGTDSSSEPQTPVMKISRRGRSAKLQAEAEGKGEPAYATYWKLLSSVCRAPMLARELERRSFSLECAMRLSTRLSQAAVDFSQAARLIEMEAKEVWMCSGCITYLIDSGQMIRLTGEHLSDLQGTGLRGITGRAVTEQETVFVHDPILDPEYDAEVDADGSDPNTLLVMIASRPDQTMDTGRMAVAITLLNVPEHLVAGDTTVCEAFISFAALVVQQATWIERIRGESEMFERIVSVCPKTVQSVDERTLVLTIMQEAQTLLHADRCSLFLAADDGTSMNAYFGAGATPVVLPMGTGIAATVLQTGQVLNIPDAYSDKRFNRDVDRKTNYRTRSILCAPLAFEGKTLAAVQLLNKRSAPGYFTQKDERAFDLFASFAGIALRNVRGAEKLARAEAEWRRLLISFQNISDIDITQSDEILQAVVVEAQRITNADRCAFFRVDFEHHCLVAKTEEGEPIRITMGSGIAGQCYQLGTAVNVPDAYEDPRFSRGMDQKTGYRTKSILALPISCDSTTLAVAQLINKQSQDGKTVQFDAGDVEILELFARFAGQMMRNADVHQHACTSGEAVAHLEQSVRYRALNLPDDRGPSPRVQERLLSGNLTAAVDGGWAPPKRHVQQLLTVDFPIMEYLGQDDTGKLATLVVEAMRLLGWFRNKEFGLEESVARNCTEALRVFFRPLAFHNFAQAFDTFQGMVFLVSRLGRKYLLPEHGFALCFAALFQHADHMGLGNSYHYKSDGLYQPQLPVAGASASAMAIHHANVAAEVLRDAANDVFAGLTSSSRQGPLQLMFDAILSTDPIRWKEHRRQFQRELVAGQTSTYRPKEPGHVQLLCLGLINGARHAFHFRSFAVAKEWAMRWAEEYYGSSTRDVLSELSSESTTTRDWGSLTEAERLAHIAPAVLSHVEEEVRPLFSMLRIVLPEMDFALRNIDANLVQWRQIMQKNEKG
eukprot:TRINITY_DN6676_c1_g1_i1.p1 TRINITY_DN6676_c1_g1~~TRINITY_DN6676_c1_g1_i1.p1  ORF type:complete len:1185 (+),score=377.43 TRINITY_DN6676_c1_g1_i1:72-3557(+)